MAKCHNCGALKTGRDCDDCGTISCDGCVRAAAVCEIVPCDYRSVDALDLREVSAWASH